MAFWIKEVYHSSDLTEILPDKEYSISRKMSCIKTQKTVYSMFSKHEIMKCIFI